MNASRLRQAPPFRYVDEVLDVDCTARRSRLALSLEQDQARFCRADALPGFLLIEAMAQASGILLRTITVGQAGGMLVGLAEAWLPEEVVFPSRLELEAQLSLGIPPLFTFDVEVFRDGKAIAGCQVQIMSRREFHEHATHNH